MRQRGFPRPEPAGAGQESVWNYPRPPALEPSTRRVRVTLAGATVAESSRAVRVLETSHPPTYYVPPSDTVHRYFSPALGSSFCEWKGNADYWTVTAGRSSVVGRAWSYPRPIDAFADLAGYVSFYPADFTCFLDDEAVRPQPGHFYGGWVTDDIVGPFKGVPGSDGWRRQPLDQKPLDQTTSRLLPYTTMRPSGHGQYSWGAAPRREIVS